MMNKSVNVSTSLGWHSFLLLKLNWLKGNDTDHVVVANMDTTLKLTLIVINFPMLASQEGGFVWFCAKDMVSKLRQSLSTHLSVFTVYFNRHWSYCLNLFVIYRSGSSKCDSGFFSEFSSLLPTAILVPSQLVIYVVSLTSMWINLMTLIVPEWISSNQHDWNNMLIFQLMWATTHSTFWSHVI